MWIYGKREWIKIKNAFFECNVIKLNKSHEYLYIHGFLNELQGIALY
jgi:hypothetical protein